MHIVLGAMALLFIVLGFAGFALGGLPSIVFWILAAFFIMAAWKMRSDRQRRREDRHIGPGAH